MGSYPPPPPVQPSSPPPSLSPPYALHQMPQFSYLLSSQHHILFQNSVEFWNASPKRNRRRARHRRYAEAQRADALPPLPSRTPVSLHKLSCQRPNFGQ